MIRDHWRLLQEISGELTPFTEKVKKQLAEKSASEHQVELENLKEEYEQKIQELEINFQGRTKEIIRERLLALAGYPLNQH
jgi:5-hydroxyisourate hydrolase-like protein (transthyretin family)